MKNFLIILLSAILFSSCNYVLINKKQLLEDMEKQTTIVVEKAYFEGQKDAINGNVRIKLTNDSIYIWTKSCWDSGKDPIYNPTYLDSK